MATRPRKPTPEPAPDAEPGDPILAVLDELRALRRDVNAFRDEVRALAERRVERGEPPGVDPGDAVPPGVAVQEPASLTKTDRKAKRSLSRLSRQR